MTPGSRLIGRESFGITSKIRAPVQGLSQRLLLYVFDLLNAFGQFFDITKAGLVTLNPFAHLHLPFGGTALHRLALKFTNHTSLLAVCASFRRAISLHWSIATDLVFSIYMASQPKTGTRTFFLLHSSHAREVFDLFLLSPVLAICSDDSSTLSRAGMKDAWFGV